MLNIPIVGAMRVYAQLVEAYHGINGYGSDTAEIYAYHLTPYSPVLHGLKAEDGDGPMGELVREARLMPARALLAIVEQFEEDYSDAKVVPDFPHWQVTFRTVREWVDVLETAGNAFDHRVHVRVERKGR